MSLAGESFFSAEEEDEWRQAYPLFPDSWNPVIMGRETTAETTTQQQLTSCVVQIVREVKKEPSPYPPQPVPQKLASNLKKSFSLFF